MELDEADDAGALNVLADCDISDARSAVNSTVLNYYKKFGRKRDLEQYFSLSTAQSEIRDPTSLFWRRMKSQIDSSDSGEKQSESSTEVCRISIKCSVPDLKPSTSQVENPKPKSDTESPPIITEEVLLETTIHTDDDSVKSYDHDSQKSVDGLLDTSMNKVLSPSSSVTSQRKLEWDSLADVGYANESDKKTSASSLSTLERMALNQQFSNNDSKRNTDIGPPTAHSTPLDEDDSKPKAKKGSKTTKFYRRDVEFVEVNMPHTSEMNPSQSINVNLTKHISFNVDKGSGVIVDSQKRDVSVKPEKVSVETEVTPLVKEDKEIQTSLLRTSEKSSGSLDFPKTAEIHGQRLPVLINLNNLRKKNRKRKFRIVRKKLPGKSKSEADKENLPAQEKSGEQVSAAESFEYMPGHIYNQNQLHEAQDMPGNAAGNKSSLESSGFLTTDSSKGSKHSFSKDLEKSINLLKETLSKRYDDSNIKQKLIQEVVQRLLKSSYRDDESTTEFLSGLSFNSKKLGLSRSRGNHTTTSSSDANNTGAKVILTRPKKSILRVDKFNPNKIASTSQSTPNLLSVSNTEKPVITNLIKQTLVSSNTESDVSSREKHSSDTAFAKTSSEELYQKYIDALKREESYKRHLKDKEMFLKQKLACSDTAVKAPSRLDVKSQNKIKDLMNDLTRNNYDDGSGDASKLEGGSNSRINLEKYIATRKQRSHSVFTLASGNSECQNRKTNQKSKMQNENRDLPIAGPSRDHCCLHGTKNNKLGFTDSSVQVNIKHQCGEKSNFEKEKHKCGSVMISGNQSSSNNISRKITHVVSDSTTGDIKYVCLCNDSIDLQEASNHFKIYKCSRLSSSGFKQQESPADFQRGHEISNITTKPYTLDEKCLKIIETSSDETIGAKLTKSSQTNLALKNLYEISEGWDKGSDKIKTSSSGDKHICQTSYRRNSDAKEKKFVREATRCIQTDISITPKISDPSLSDINIINDADCVQLISENYRELFKSTSQSEAIDEDQNAKYFTVGSEFSEGISTASDYNKKEGVGKNSKNTLYIKPKFDKKNQSDNNETGQIPKSDDNFSIPIQGTNMTLLVTIGSNAEKVPVEFKEVKTQGIATDKADTAENATSLREECSKGVQSRITNIFSQINKIDSCEKRNPSVNASLTKQTPDYNTYPITQINERKSFMRSGADIGKISKIGCGVQANTEVESFTDKNQSNVPKSGYNTYPNVNYEQTYLKYNLTKDCIQTGEKVETVANSICPETPESAICKGIRAEGAACLTINPIEIQKPMLIARDQSKLNCQCPETSKCKGICEGDAACRMKKTSEIQKSSSLTCDQSTFTKFKSGDTNNLISKEYFIQPDSNTITPEQPKCTCPESAKCKGTCNEDAACRMQERKSVLIQTDEKREPTDDRKQINRDDREYLYSKKGHDKGLQQNVKVPEETIADQSQPQGSQKLFLRSDFERVYTESEDWVQTDQIDNKNLKTQKEKLTKPSSSSVEYKGSSSDEKSATKSKKSCDSDKLELGPPRDLISEMIQDITKRYSKKDIEKSQRKKCFKEIMTILNYLLETEDCSDQDKMKTLESLAFHDYAAAANDTECISHKKIKENPSGQDCMTETPILVEKFSSHNTKSKNDHKKSQGTQSFVPDCRQSEKSVDSVTNETGFLCDNISREKEAESCTSQNKMLVDKGVQLSVKKSKSTRVSHTESSDIPLSTDCHGTSSDSATCKMLNKIRRECEKYHLKRCKSHHCKQKKYETSSSTSVNCEQCKRVHYCPCRGHKCKGYRPKSSVEKIKKKCVAYNLIIQTSESMISEETACDNNSRPLQNIIVKVPPKYKQVSENIPFKEMSAKIEKKMAQSSPRESKCQRSKSVPNESSTDETPRIVQMYTVREYLERNRPDFVEQCSNRQNSLRMISEIRPQDQCCCDPSYVKMVVYTPKDNCNGCVEPRTMCCGGVQMICNPCMDPSMHSIQNEVTRIANERAAQRDLLSLQMQLYGESSLSALSNSDLRRLARDLGADIRRKKVAPKFISERDMKKHSANIYNKLPEAQRKKKELKKQSYKNINLLMASLFKKNLQINTLRGFVNLSNYNQVIKI